MKLDVGPLDEVRVRRKFVVEHDGRQILVLVHEDRVYALDNICVHRERELVRGMVFKGKLVCPGHQWAFDLDTGYESIKCEYQPVYPVVVEDGRVLVDATPVAEPAAPE